jgi:hypothetical protein
MLSIYLLSQIGAKTIKSVLEEQELTNDTFKLPEDYYIFKENFNESTSTVLLIKKICILTSTLTCEQIPGFKGAEIRNVIPDFATEEHPHSPPP